MFCVLQIESLEHRMAFVNSAHTLVKSFGFDGLDLAWEFPETKPKKIRSSLGRTVDFFIVWFCLLTFYLI